MSYSIYIGLHNEKITFKSVIVWTHVNPLTSIHIDLDWLNISNEYVSVLHGVIYTFNACKVYRRLEQWNESYKHS